MEAAGFFEASVPLSQNTQYHIPKDCLVENDERYQLDATIYLLL